MKKIPLVTLASFTFLFLFSGMASAYGPGCTANGNTMDPAAWNSATSEPIGLVPCGISVDANNRVICPCELGHLFIMISGIITFLLTIATAIAALMIALGGVLIMLSGFNPNWASTGKTIIWWSIIGVITMFAAWLIINTIMTRVFGINNWNVLPF